MEIRLDTPVVELAGVGSTRSKALHKIGIECVRDLLAHYPRSYEDRRESYTIASAPLDHPVCVRAMVAEPAHSARVRKGLEITHVKVVDSTATMKLTFFNQSYVREALCVGASYIFYGMVEVEGRGRRMTNPVFEREEKQRFTECIMPIYPLTAGLGNHFMAGLMMQVMSAIEGWEECLPTTLRETHQLVNVQYALRNIHFPQSFEQLEVSKRRMVFEELFVLTAGLALLKNRRDTENGPAFKPEPWQKFRVLLPYEPTGAQKRVMEEMANDLASGTPMNRLIQGDVGSGKTTVAAYGIWLMQKNGWQTALMAPTEILAEQHYRSLTAILTPAGVRIALLTSAAKGNVRKKLLAQIEAGEFDLIVGTHALLSEDVHYAHLGLVVADEQHRFGVAQRAALAAKGGKNVVRPHVLVMSATPIPRTLALMIYGDLDISIMDELPPGRTPVATYLISEDKRTRMYGFVRKLVGEGRQVYIVCPAVEESEPGKEGSAMDLKAVTKYAAELKDTIFPDLRVGFVHGKLKSKEKETVMAAFASGDLDVLVATTVIEVGVDVPNAALMIIENAERFGLSQLHQLRGRVGRGNWQSYCVMISAVRREESRARLKVMTSTTDGFKIAEEDLKLRGPGDFFGSRQHGLPTLRVADLAEDMVLLHEAQDAAEELLRIDPELIQPEHQLLRKRVKTLFAENPDIFN